MSQNDFNLANQGFASMRADMNSAFQALASNSSGATAPSTTYAYQWWYDTSTDILKQRNAANDGWIEIATFDQTNDEWLIVKKTSLTGSAALPAGTTAQRDGSPAAGYLRWNTTLTQLEVYNGTSWVAAGPDLSSVAEDIIPDADSTRDLGSTSAAWALGFFDEIRVATVSNLAGTGPATLTAQKACKAHGSANQASPALNAGSLNISSYTDPGAGRFQFNYTTALSAATYSAALNFNASAGGRTESVNASFTEGITYDSSGSAQDNGFLAIQVMGDLA